MRPLSVLTQAPAQGVRQLDLSCGKGWGVGLAAQKSAAVTSQDSDSQELANWHIIGCGEESPTRDMLYTKGLGVLMRSLRVSLVLKFWVSFNSLHVFI